MKLSRRQALTALWGTPLMGGAPACKRARDLPGAFLGARHDVGHLLRNGPKPVSGAPTERLQVAIVGAGPAGLSAAWKLRREGIHDFVVFDLEAQPGGTSCSSEEGIVPHPWGAHYVPLPLPHHHDLIALLDEMGALSSTDPPTAKETQLVRSPEERLFAEGSWHEGLFPVAGASPEDLDQWRRFSKQTRAYADYRDSKGRRAFTIPSAFCSDAEELKALDRINAARWLDDHDYTSARLRWYVEYACRDDYGTTLAQTSAWAMLFYFAARVPSSKEESAPFLTWPEGNGRIVNHLRSKCEKQLRLNQLVTDVSQSAERVRLNVLEADTGTSRVLEAEQVILAVPRFVAQRIFSEFRAQPPEFLKPFSYSAWLVANLHLSGRPKQRGVDLAWDSVIYESPALGYVDASHQTLRDRGPTVWSYYYPLSQYEPVEARRWLLSAKREDLVEGVVSDLQSAHPDLLDYVQRVDVWRWGHAMVRPSPGLIWGGARQAAAEPRGRVRFAHSDLSGLALFEEAQYWGLRAASEVLGQLQGAAPPSEAPSGSDGGPAPG